MENVEENYTDLVDGLCLGKISNSNESSRFSNLDSIETTPQNSAIDDKQNDKEETEPKTDRNPARPVTVQVVDRDSKEYNMNHPKRGKCLVFYYSKYEHYLKLDERKSAEEDKKNVETAFKNLQFQVVCFHNLTKADLLENILKVSSEDHSNNDCLAIVFMSHGTFEEDTNKQWLYAFDARISPESLWKGFAGNNCLSLVGKPKLFFIQACRGTRTDSGITLSKAMKVTTDSRPILQAGGVKEEYTLSSYADILIMWSSFEGHYAFKSNNNGIRGSVFIHFLCKVYREAKPTDNLSTLLLEVTKRVAVEYESQHPRNPILHSNKQIPETKSTLLRHIYFRTKV